MAKTFEVYLHRCSVNGKGYVGITCRGVRQRLYCHESDARHGSEKPFHRAIRKHGIAAFETTIIASGLSREEAEAAEIAAIAKLGTFGRGGYNATTGGDGTRGAVISQERREAISRHFKSLPRSEQHRQRIAEALKGRPKPAHVMEAARQAKLGKRQPKQVADNSRAALETAKAIWTGQRHTAESKAAMRAAKSGYLRIVRANGDSETLFTTISAIAQQSGISSAAICAAIRKARPIAKDGPLRGCTISKVEGFGNGR